MDERAQEQIRDVMRDMVGDAFVSGVNALVIKDGEEVFYGQEGVRDIETAEPMTRDTIFRLYSMSKPVTAAAVMILLQEGKIDLGDSVGKYLPGFEKPILLKGWMPMQTEKPVTIQELLNMTSGVVYPGENGPAEVRTGILMEEIKDKLLTKEALSTVEIANRLGRIPLAFEPGERWNYGMSADVLGAVVEQVSGLRFGEFLKERIFLPLGMEDTDFYVPAEKQNRLAKVYRGTEQGLALYTEPHLGIQNRMEFSPAFESGGAGLCSTVDDYSRFSRMLLNRGTLDGVTILKPGVVDFMTSCHVTERQQAGVNEWESLAGYTYGNLLRVMKDPGSALSLGCIGEYGWDGWLGTYMANIPEKNITFLLMQQRTDSGTTGYVRRIRNIILAE